MKLKMRRFVVAAVVLAVALGLPVVDAAPSHAGITLAVSIPRPIAGERVTLKGKFGTAVQRPVHLQYLKRSRWVTLAKKTTASTGRFAFTTKVPGASRKFRAVAPRFVKNGRTYRKTTSDPRTVKTVRQTARLDLVRAPVAQAKGSYELGAPSGIDLTPGTATFTPVRAGRKVLIQRYAGGSWRTVREGTQNRRGAFAFRINRRSGAHRAVTVARKGARAKASAKVLQPSLTKWSDEFNDTNQLDTTKWAYRALGSRNEKGGRECSESSDKSVEVSEGTLRLQTRAIGLENERYLAHQSKCQHGQYYNGHIGTQGKFSFQHGIMAARIRMQPSRGHHGGFWSQPQVNPADGAEIDAVEYYGDTYASCLTCQKAPVQHSIYVGSVQADKVLKNRDYLLDSGQKWSSGYHVFSVEWTPTQYIFRIDGHETFRTSKGVSKTEQYLILSLLASDWELKQASPTGTAMQIDWVRVWRQP